MNYPYVYSSGKLKQFLELIPTVGTPPQITQKYLEAAGFKSTNDRAIISVLKFVELLGEDGKPTEDYKLLRDRSQFGAILASHIKKGYSDLFSLYPETNDALKNFFATKTTAGDAALGQIVATFKTLCESADFEAPAPLPTGAEEPKGDRPVSRSPKMPVTPESGVTINLNIQLQLPPTEDSTIYDKIFDSLKRHLIERKPSPDA
jgi:hypothetical protein